MATLMPGAIDDLVNLTLENIKKDQYNQIAQLYQRYPFTSRLFQKEKMSVEGGDYIDRQLQVRTAGSAKNVGFFEVDAINVVKTMEQLRFDWKFTTTGWAYDVKENQINRGSRAIVKLVKTRESAALLDMVEQMESDFWTNLPAIADPTRPFGVDYYINKTGAATGGFNGGDPTGFAAGAGGLTVAAVPAWANYCGQYVNVAKNDLIRYMRAAYTKTGFKSPVKVNETNRGARRFGIYTQYDNVIAPIEELGEAQNDNLGPDIASMDGKILFRGIEIEWVPILDTVAKQPVIGIDWAWFYPVIQSGSYMRRTGPNPSATQHDTREVHRDITWNVVCDNRRRQWIMEIA